MFWLKLIFVYPALAFIFYFISGNNGFTSMFLSLAMYVAWELSLYFLKDLAVN